MALHFSKRTNWSLGENALSVELSARRARGAAILDLTESNPTRAGFSYPEDIVLKPLASSEALAYEPDPRGLLKVREALSRYYALKNAKLSPERFVLTSSTSEGYSFLFRLLMEPGDKVLVPAPSYPLFSYLADINDVAVEHYFLRYEENRWRINMESIEHAIDKKTRAIILVSPNNPTGSFVKKDELEALNRLCSAHGIALISDEVFADYIMPAYQKEFVSLTTNSDVLTFVVSGISKAMALPQMKLSWIAVSGPEDDREAALSRLEVIADTYLSVNTPVQHAAALWLSDPSVIRDQVRSRVVGNYAFLKHAVQEKGVGKCLELEGGWYAVLRITDLKLDEDWAVAFLKEEGVLVHPGFFFDFADEEHLVLSLLPERTVFEEGVEKLCQRLSLR